MKWALYNVLFALIYPFLLPGFLLRMFRRGGYAARMGDRFALYPDGLFGKNRPLFDSHSTIRRFDDSTISPVWIHAVSVGEVQVAGQLMREWRKVDPSVRFCFSTTSSTGWMMARKELEEGQRSKVKGRTEEALAKPREGRPPCRPRTRQSASLPRQCGGFASASEDEKFHCLTSDLGSLTSSRDVLIYNPLDFPNFVKSALRTVRPRAIVLTESEIWPNFIRQTKKAGIPLFLINARVSDRSAPRYRLARWWFGDVLSSFTRIFAQSDLDKSRLVAAGAPAEIVDVTGSFKFDVAHRNEAKERELREWIFGNEVKVKGEGEQRKKILLGGSTWPGEDEALLRIYKSILQLQLPTSTLLVLAPRHFEKADAVEANIRKAGFACVRRSKEKGQRSKVKGQTEDEKLHCLTSDLGPLTSSSVYLADTTGELMGLYGIADVVFVGKSLCAHGSQNMIEPCLCGKPTVVGPFTENFRPVMSDLLAADAIVQVKDEEELKRKIMELVGSGTSGEDTASPLGARAKAAVERRCGVVARCVEAVRRAL